MTFNGKRLIYLDNAATSWPKPERVYQAMDYYMRHIGGNPGRSGHRLSIKAARSLLAAREAVAELLSVDDPLRIIFTSNATTALNIALKGLLRPGDHVVTTSIEHNSVIRPLRTLEREGVEISIAQCGQDGSLSPASVAQALKSNTRLVVVNHASNVVGTILPIHAIAEVAHHHDCLLLVDAAQSVGAVPIDMGEIDLLAFAGHKTLMGPQGTGGLCIRAGLEEQLAPLVEGGTGSRSSEQYQPDFLTDKYESGTLNGPGLAGLDAGVRFILEQGVENIRRHEEMLTRQLIEGLVSIPGVTIYGTRDPSRQVALVSFNIAGVLPSEVGLRLDEDFGVLCRVGLQCAPLAHQTIGSFPTGTVRLSPNYFTTPEEIEYTIDAVRRIATHTVLEVQRD